MMDYSDKYIRFDWAVKRILRDKANFGVLEGLMTVLLEEEVKIVEILESESNQNDSSDKFNRVDIMAKNARDEYIIIEVQQRREVDYLERILYGVAKTITEHVGLGERYSQVKKVYSVNILYFDLGTGSDYLYHGQTTFTGVHSHDTLLLSEKDAETFMSRSPKNIFPEYFLIRVNEFNKVATTPLEEWIEYIKSGHIDPETKAPGLQEARKKLTYITMSANEKRAYERHLENMNIQESVLQASKLEGLAEGREEGMAIGREEGMVIGREEGRKEGREEGREEGRAKGKEETSLEIACKLKKMGMDEESIMVATGVSLEDIHIL